MYQGLPAPCTKMYAGQPAPGYKRNQGCQSPRYTGLTDFWVQNFV